jgi:hypothetical protein
MDFIYVYSAQHPKAGQIANARHIATDEEGYPLSRSVIIADKGNPADIVSRAEAILRLETHVPKFSVTCARSILEYYGQTVAAR